MKKTLLAITLFTSVFAKAQFTEANHAPTSGDAFSTNQCDSLGIVTGSAGAGSIWNYSTLPIHSSMVNNYIATVSSNTANSGYLKVSSSLTNSSYYTSNPSLLNYHGGNINVATVNAELNYTSPAIVALYPMSLGTTTTNLISGTGNVTLFGSITFSGTCAVLADGTGTLVIGTRTLTNATRVKTTQVINATAAFGAAVITLENFDYYSINNSKRPFLTISTSTLSAAVLGAPSSQVIVTVQKDYVTVGLTEKTNEFADILVYPNPSNSYVNFNTNNENITKIVLYDITGRVIATEQILNEKAKIDVSSLNTGMYLYSAYNKHNQQIKTGKFAVTK